jgi:2-polyprenyl-3-methyl-5-hydroxy-6-metoxy-1,4-benzoquinol methylase
MIEIEPYRSPPLGEEAALTAIARGEPAMWYEAPDLEGGKVTEWYPEVKGWATAGAGIERVTVTIDRKVQLRAVHGVSRPDLREWIGEEAAVNCGFVLRLDPNLLPPGPHELTIVAVPNGGEPIGVSGTIERVAPGADERVEGATEVDGVERFVPAAHAEMSFAPEHLARYRWAAEVVGEREVLDAGCGVGWGTATLAAASARVTGVDVAPIAVEEARRGYGAQAEFAVADLLELPFEDGRFDAAVCFEAIEHVADPGRALDELRRVLKPGGLLLISTPNKDIYPAGNPFHVHEFTREEFREALAARFSSVALYGQQTYRASLLASEAVSEMDDPRGRIEANVAKTVGAPAGNELYMVAAASDSELPRAPTHLVLGGEADRDDLKHELEMWKERAVKAEIEMAIAQSEAHVAAWMQRRAAAKAAGREDELRERLAEVEAER